MTYHLDRQCPAGCARGLAVVLMSLLLAGCAGTGEMPATAGPPDDHRNRHDNLNAVLWMQIAPEYEGNTLALYRSASDHLPGMIAATGVSADIDQADAFGCQVGHHCPALADAGLQPAVVLDIDETVLDNSAFQARLVLEDRPWSPQAWDKWVAMRAAGAVPGAIAFIEQAHLAGAAIIYITNRACAPRAGDDNPCPQKDDTRANLTLAGFPPLGVGDRLILRAEQPDWDTSEKQSRRAAISGRYRIGMLIGDDIGDLASGIKYQSVETRRAFTRQHASLYGHVWFQLANPTYGSWTSPFRDRPGQDLLRP